MNMTTIDDCFDGVRTELIDYMYSQVTQYIYDMTVDGEYTGDPHYLKLKQRYEAELDKRDK